MPPPASTAGAELRRWVVFCPGYWKGSLYTPADVQRIAANYAYLKPHLTPTAKLGHQSTQQLLERLRSSLGFANLGTVADGGLTPDTCFWLTITGIPVEVAGQINAGRINSGSVELAPHLPDPNDPGRTIPGPILTAISLLGEEQPAVKDSRLRMPRAVFADGTPVPPAASAAKWLDAMAEVAKECSALSGNRRTHDRTSRFTLCFSDYRPEGSTVTLEELIAAIKVLPADQMQQLLAAIQPPPPPNGQITNGVADPNDPLAGLQQFMDDPQCPASTKALMSAFSAFASGMTKRMGAMEAAVGDIQALKPQAEMAAKFSAEYHERLAKDRKDRVIRDVQKAIDEGRLEPRDRDDKITAGLAKNDTQTFSEGTNKGKTEYEVWRDELLSRQPSHMFSEQIEEPKTPSNPLEDPFVVKTLNHLPKGRRVVAAAMAAK